MFLLIPCISFVFLVCNLHLHSNMFLLIPRSFVLVALERVQFTFQYVSINTGTSCMSSVTRTNLHSNMFLLIRISYETDTGLYFYLHSNMFLLILWRAMWKSREWRYLHSNMFLLIPEFLSKAMEQLFIYIPICFY